MDLLNFFFNLHQIMYSFGKQREKIWGEGHFKHYADFLGLDSENVALLSTLKAAASNIRMLKCANVSSMSCVLTLPTKTTQARENQNLEQREDKKAQFVQKTIKQFRYKN